MENATVATGISFLISTNITADIKILYVPVSWEGCLFIHASSNLTLKLFHQRTLCFLGGLEGVPYTNISIRLT